MTQTISCLFSTQTCTKANSDVSMLTSGDGHPRRKETETKFTVAPLVSVNGGFTYFVYVAPNSCTLIPTNSSEQCQTTRVLIDSLQNSPLQLRCMVSLNAFGFESS